jgi:hypothetical protein
MNLMDQVSDLRPSWPSCFSEVFYSAKEGNYIYAFPSGALPKGSIKITKDNN